MSVQALRPQLAVERLDEAVVGRLAGPREVQGDVVGIGPQVKITGDKLTSTEPVQTSQLFCSMLELTRPYPASEFVCVLFTYTVCIPEMMLELRNAMILLPKS